MGNGVVRLLGLEPTSEHSGVHSVEELEYLVHSTREAGLLEEEQERMVAGVFDFREHRVSQVMTPRTELDAVAVATPWPEVVRRVATSHHQRLPIYADDLDHILGVVYAKDVLRALADPQQGPHINVRALLRPVPFVPETLPLDKLLVELRRHKAHLAIVLDEFGGTAGLVTLEDLVEEIVGEVGEGSSAETAVERRADGSIALDGLLPLEDVNERLGLDLEDPHYATLGGYVFGRLGRMPHVGDEVILSTGQRLRVDALDGARVARVVLTPLEAANE
jgi:CBS domain containing-hemolysin-like protein